MRDRRVGPLHLLLAAYALFVVAAGARSAAQLAAHPRRALLAYVLSAVAAGIYLGGLVLVAGAARLPRLRPAALAWCGLELAGVLVVGSVSLLSPGRFPAATVWSAYGAGYGWVPLLLPLLAAAWLHRAAARPPAPVALAVAVARR